MQRRVFAPVIAAAILVVLGGDMALQLGRAGARFMPRLDDSHPALARVEPEPGQMDRPRLARRVVLVIIDGLRLRESIGLPYLDELRSSGIEAIARSHYPTFSRPNYVSIVTGVPPRQSGVRTNNYDAQVGLDSLMDRAHAAGLRSGFLSNYSPALPRMFTRPATEDEREGTTLRYVSDFDDSHYVQWPGGFVNAAHLLLAQGYPLVIMHLGEPDIAGHRYGGDSPEYLAAARLADRELQAALEASGADAGADPEAVIDLSRDAVVVVADHGHTDSGGHGGLEEKVVEVPLVLAGAGIRRGAAVVGARLIDVAPTVATLLGVKPPGHGLGRTLTEALDLPVGVRQQLTADDARRVERNQVIVASAHSDAERQLAGERIWRLPLVLGLIAVAIGLLLLGRKLDALRLDWRVLAIALPAFPVTYYLAIGLLEQHYSPSAIPELGDVVHMLVRWGLVSTAAHLVVSWIALRGRVVLRDRLAAANGLTACGLVLAVLPAGLAWALFAQPYLELPGPQLMVLIPATLLAVAFYAMASATTLVLEIVIFFARAVDPRNHVRRLERAAKRARSRIDAEPD